MEHGILEIGPAQLALALVFILAAGAASLYQGLKLERDLLVGTLRTFAQLFLLGYILKYIFHLNSVWPVLAKADRQGVTINLIDSHHVVHQAINLRWHR